MFRATVTRSTAEPEEITAGAGTGYFALVWSSGSRALAQHRRRRAARSSTASPPSSPGGSSTDAEVLEVAERGRARARPLPPGRRGARAAGARHAIVATKAFDAARLIRDLPADTSSALNAIPYGPTVVMAMLTNETRPMPWDDLYALATPKRAFNMLFNTVNVLRPRSAVRVPGGSLMVYRAGHAALEMFDQPDSGRRAGLPDDLYAIYPDARGIVSETTPAQAAAHAPVRGPGRAALQPALERPLGRIHLAGDYLGGVYTDTAISSGQEAALAVRAALQAAEA